MKPRVITVLEPECYVCGHLWEAQAFADFPYYYVAPEFVDPEDAECPKCGTYLPLLRGSEPGSMILDLIHRVGKTAKERERARIEALIGKIKDECGDSPYEPGPRLMLEHILDRIDEEDEG
ncbi:MAG: hypothetical protein M3P49_02145 [Actinomycetota bacterium]|nr:hypothetical protein [Actinomycetota bacterium]